MHTGNLAEVAWAALGDRRPPVQPAGRAAAVMAVVVLNRRTAA